VVAFLVVVLVVLVRISWAIASVKVAIILISKTMH